MNDRLYRSRDDRIIAGVAGGVAERLGVDPSLVRILWVLLIIPTGFIALLLYVIMAFVVPEEPAADQPWGSGGQQGGYASPDDAGSVTTSPTAPPAPGPSGMAGADSIGMAAGFASTTGSAAEGPGGPTAPTVPTSPTSPTGPTSPTSPTGPTSAMGPTKPIGPAVGGPIGAPPSTWRDQRRALREARRRERGSSGALILGLILILVGAYALIRIYVPAFDADRLWPVILVLIGVALLIGSVRRTSGPPTA
jgi:phage shock protein PspC (stress-responsive transcriptional regulator)